MFTGIITAVGRVPPSLSAALRIDSSDGSAATAIAIP